MLSIAGMAVILLGTGCRAKPLSFSGNSASAPPVVNVTPPTNGAAPAAHAPDPLADDLDAAIKDLNAIE